MIMATEKQIIRTFSNYGFEGRTYLRTPPQKSIFAPEQPIRLKFLWDMYPGTGSSQ